jgi:hypothetical protein
VKLILLIFLSTSVLASRPKHIEQYCHQLGGKVKAIVEAGIDELAGQTCYDLHCESETTLKKIAGKEGIDLVFSRVDENRIQFRVCEDREFGATSEDVKVLFSFLDFEKSQGSLQSFYLKEKEPCWKSCQPEHKDSTPYDCKHCIRKHYFPSLSDVEFTLVSYRKAPYCETNKDPEKCESYRGPASAENKMHYHIEDLVEEMWCDYQKKDESLRCKEREYKKSIDKFQKYFINFPLAAAPEYAFNDGSVIKKTDVKVICLNTGKTPFDLNYKYVSCNDGHVYELKEDELKVNTDTQGLDGLREPASSK